MIDVTYKGENQKTPGMIYIDPVVGAIDLCFAVVIELPVALSEIELRDGETHNGEFLNRRVFAFPKKEFIKLFEKKSCRAVCYEYDRKSKRYKDRKVLLRDEAQPDTHNWQINVPAFPAGIKLIETLYKEEAMTFTASYEVKSNSSTGKRPPHLEEIFEDE